MPDSCLRAKTHFGGTTLEGFVPQSVQARCTPET
jgi:hypothetical protein